VISLTNPVGPIAFPDTPLTRSAHEIAAEFCETAVLLHSIRSYVWGAHFAAGRDFDAELLLIAALLHDIALGDAFDSHRLPFEVASGNVAKAFTAGAGWAHDARELISKIITLHVGDDVDFATNPEAHLLQIGVSLDVSGYRFQETDPELVAAVMQRFPRAGFKRRFAELFNEQATRKPTCAAARLIKGGLLARIVDSPFTN
jgi:HD domain